MTNQVATLSHLSRKDDEIKSSTVRKIIHCDADCFFAAVEMRDDHSLVGRPLAIGGAVERRGVISTCNYEARAFGVRSAMATAMAKRLCPELLVLPHSMDKYKQASLQMRDIFQDYFLSLDSSLLLRFCRYAKVYKQLH